MGASAHQRRGAPRVPLRSKLTLFVGNKKLSCRVVNISALGALVQSPVPFQWGRVARAFFGLPVVNGRIDTSVLLVRQVSSGRIHHLGLRFLDLTPREKSSLERLVAHTIHARGGEREAPVEDAGDPPHLRQLYAAALRELDEAGAR